MTRCLTRRRIRKRGIPLPPGPPDDPQWSVALSASSIDEGASVDLTVSVDLQDYVPAAGETASVTLTTMTAADFAAQFPGETQATSGNGDFPTGYTAAMAAAIATLGGSAVTTTVNGITAQVLTFKLDTFTSVQITRATSARVGDNGSRRLVHSILSPTVGTVLVDSDSCVINDVPEEPAQGDLASIELTNAYVSVMGPDVGPAADTEIGRFVFKDNEGNVLDPGADALAFATDGDVGGRFAIHDAGSGTDRYRLRHTAVVADFETVAGGVGSSGHFLKYVTTVEGTVDGVTITQPLDIKKRYTAIEPTGDETANEFTYTTCDEFRTLVNTTGNSRTIKPAPGTLGVLRKSNYTNDITIDDDNITIEGSAETVLNHRKGMKITQCDNVVIRNQAFGVGTVDATSTAKKDIDNLEIYGAGGYVSNILFDHCVFFASNDELCRAKYSARRVLFNRCIFAYPFYPANHTKSVVHNHGPAASDRCAHIIFDKCIIWGPDTRMVQVQSAFGFVQVNCIVGFWKDNQAAIRFIGEDASGTAWPADGQALANLFIPQINNSTYRGGAIEFLNQRVALTHNYVPQTGSYTNQFVIPSTDTFTNDPLTVANGAITIVSSDSNDVVRDTANFEFEGITVMPTGTEDLNRALFEDVIRDCGNDSLFCRDVIAEVRAGAATLRAGLVACSPAMFEAAYGSGTPPWSGGGTYGHGVAGRAFPDETTTGVPAGTILTASAQIETNTAAVVIEDKDVSGAIIINSGATGATVRRCRVTADSFVGIYVFADDVTIEDCEITTAASGGTKAVILEDCTGTTVRRCNMHDTEDGVYMNGSGHQILDNYIHDMASGGGDPHFDCIQLVGGTTSDVLIKGNAVYGGTGPGASSAITMGAVQGITIQYNFIDGGGYGLTMDDRFPEGADPITGMVVTNNRFGTHVFGPVTVEESLGEWTSTELTWAGNVDDATGASISSP